MNKGIRREIEGLAIGLDIGQSLSGLLCPFCNHPDRVFSIRREATGILYNCYRATCTGSSGFIGSSGVHTPARPKPAAKEPTPYLGDMRPLNGAEREALQGAYRLRSITMADYVAGVDMLTGRYIIPVVGPGGESRGTIARVPPGDTRKPKTISYIHDHSKPFQSWYGVKGPVGTLVLVEDCWSAMRVVQDTLADAVALLGTHMTQLMAYEIYNRHPSDIMICLDKDATAKAFQMRKDWALYWNCPVRVVPLERDIKDSTADEVRSLFDARAKDSSERAV